jgi:putative nucleotidyltransferase with HDIG domain
MPLPDDDLLHEEPQAPTYDDALALFHDWTETESLRRHGYAVEAAMAGYARHFGEDEERWRIAGLLHDLDYEKHPSLDEHPFVGERELERLGYPADVREAILGHAPYTNTPRSSRLAKTLFAVDELAGFVVAVALVRPGRLDGMTARSVRKKLKDAKFAAAVSRDDIRQGAEELEVDLGEHVGRVIESLQREAPRLGLA